MRSQYMECSYTTECRKATSTTVDALVMQMPVLAKRLVDYEDNAVTVQVFTDPGAAGCVVCGSVTAALTLLNELDAGDPLSDGPVHACAECLGLYLDDMADFKLIVLEWPGIKELVL